MNMSSQDANFSQDSTSLSLKVNPNTGYGEGVTVTAFVMDFISLKQAWKKNLHFHSYV